MCRGTPDRTNGWIIKVVWCPFTKVFAWVIVELHLILPRGGYLHNSHLSQIRLRVVPHFSSGIVERAKRTRVKITPNAREIEKRWHATGREPTSSPGRFSLRVRAGGWVACENAWSQVRCWINCPDYIIQSSFVRKNDVHLRKFDLKLSGIAKFGKRKNRLWKIPPSQPFQIKR